MKDLKQMDLIDLVTRFNEIRKEQQELEIEHNAIVMELWERIPKLKDDVNIQPKVIKRGVK